MADVDHELGAIRFIVNAPLSSKVAMFNNVATQHRDSQLLNPFSGHGDITKRTFSKDDYGKPLAGSLTEMRGAKANIHVCKEMLQLCQIIDDEGWPYSPENPDLKVMRFGDLFNIYTLISDKVVGILLRARKYKLIDFEGEVLFQRRDDDVLIFMLKSLEEIKIFLEEKQDEVRRSVSPAPNRNRSSDVDFRRSASPAPKDNVSRASSPSSIVLKSERPSSPATTEEIKINSNGACNFNDNEIREEKGMNEDSSDHRVNITLQNSVDFEKNVTKTNVNEKSSLLVENGVAEVSISNNNIDFAPEPGTSKREFNSEDVKESTSLSTDSKDEDNIILKNEADSKVNFTTGGSSIEENNSVLGSSEDTCNANFLRE